ncbi:MAG TPA: hypothetical protein DCY13_00950 [Verrucomicrobiales bacterium]|nr:hypothetical protein [Verrucomicrobiales bacterium]
MRLSHILPALGVALWLLTHSHATAAARVSGELQQWHKVTLSLDGPAAAEDATPNPFADYRLDVTFTHSSGTPKITVPGYFAADGKAGESSATKGSVWRANFSAPMTGGWTYTVSMVAGTDVAISGEAGQPVAGVHGQTGTFTVAASDKQAPDFRARGTLEYVGERFLKFAGDWSYFLKGGVDSPETLLGYADFDGTFRDVSRTNRPPAPHNPIPLPALDDGNGLHRYLPHVQDWRAGDPTWQGGKGKGLIGGLNYLASQGVNSVYFLTMNVNGDGRSAWPWADPWVRDRFDCSKLDQWEIVFQHMTKLGIMLHVVTQETENDHLLDRGELGRERKLYYRELIARFGHHLALNWNIGEENTQSTGEIVDMVRYLHGTDPYQHNIVIHTFPNQQDKVYTPLLGNNSLLTGASLQNHWDETHKRTLQWVNESARAGRPWVVANDEQGNASLGVPPDPGYRGFSGFAEEKNGRKYDLHDIRKHTLWGNLMAGGAGVEYYFGYQLLENDLVAEDWRSRDRSWDYCRIALEFFADEEVPFWEMSNANELIGNPGNNNDKYCLARAGDTYLVYLPEGGTSELDLAGTGGSFSVKWFNPREGGKLAHGSVRSVKGGGKVALGNPPADAAEDWLVVVRK